MTAKEYVIERLPKAKALRFKTSNGRTYWLIRNGRDSMNIDTEGKTEVNAWVKVKKMLYRKETGYKKLYNNSLPEMKEAWKHLCKAREKVGWKDFYFMVLKMQKETADESKYELIEGH